MYAPKRVIGLVILIVISGMVCSTSHAEDACAARMVNVSGDVPRDDWADAIYSEIHDSQSENLTWGDIFSHSQERQKHDTCKYVEKSIDSTNAVCKNIYGNQTNDSVEGVKLKHSLEDNIRMSVTDANNNRIEDCLEGSAMRAGIDGGAEVDVIVMYRKKSSEPSYSGSYSTLNTLGATVKYNYKTIDATALKMPAGNLNGLAEVPGVEMIYLDHEVHALLDTSVPVIGGDQARPTFGVSGADVTIAVIDTGIDASHESLDDLDDDPETDDDKVIAFEDFVNSRTDPYDDNGHGTHCAGIAAGTGGDSDYVGVAPMSRLVGVKVLDQYGSGSESDCIAGIEWCVLNKDVYGIEVISLSWGADRNGDGTSPMEIACDSAVDAGIVVCVAAGNSGPGSRTIGTPASAKEVISVGAIEDSMDIAYFSSRGPTADGRTKPDVCAVGVDVIAPAANSGDGYVAHSGTSMATPHVAGVAALMIEYNPYITPSEVKDILRNTSVDKGDPGPDNTYGWGVVDSVAALDNISAIRITLDAGGSYDPGDRVTITGSTSNRTIPISAVVNIIATSPDGSVVAFNTTTSDGEGDFSVDFVLPGDSEPGDYKVEATASPNDETGRRIATFKVGTLIIGMDAPDMVIIGDPYLLGGGVRYDDGAPVSGADLNVIIRDMTGTSVHTDHTSSNAAGHFTIQWTPAEASTYTVRITARDAATLKVGLNTTTFQAPRGIVAVAVPDSWGTDHNEYTIWDDLNRNWYKYGDYLIDINYIALNKEDITYDDLNLCGADLLVVSNAWDDGADTRNNWEFSDSEISAIKRYVQEGHGLVGTSGTLSTDVPNNMLLAPMFGLDPGEIGRWDCLFHPIFELLRPDHPLFTRIPDPYRSEIDTTVANLALSPEYPGTVVARSKDHTASIYEYRGDHVAAGASVYFTHIVELSDANKEDRQIVYNSFVWAKTNIERKPHEIAVYTLEAPDWIEPDSFALINATIKNNGLNGESNIEVNFMVDGAIVESATIASLPSGASIPVSFEWATPPTERVHDVAVHAAPVSGEHITVNNHETRSVYVVALAGYITVAVLDSPGTDFASDFYWDDLSDNWYEYGKYIIDINYTALDKEDITYDDIRSTGADVLAIPDSSVCSLGWEFTDSEIDAISQYVQEGHGLTGSFGTLSSDVPNNMLLAPMFGLDPDAVGYGRGGFDPVFDLLDPDNSLFAELPDTYRSETEGTVTGLALDPDYPGAIVAKSKDRRANIYEYNGDYVAAGASVYFTHGPEISGFGAKGQDMQITYNSFVWAKTNIERKPHEIAVYTLEAPDWIEPDSFALINATIKNNGLNDESTIEVNFMVDGVIVESATIPNLSSGASSPVSFGWAIPPTEGMYDIAIYAVLVSGEDITVNNAKNTSVRVITPAGCLKAVVLDSYITDDGDITIFWDDLGDSWYIYGDYTLDIDYTTLNIENITYQEISDTGADVLIISCARDREFSDSEIAAISQYVEKGHGIIATAGTFDSQVSNNIKLAPLFGMDDIAGSAYWTSGNFALYYPDHPIFLGLDDSYQSESRTTNYPWDTTTGSVLAMTDDGRSSIITNDVTGTDQGYANIYLNHFPESDAGPNDTQIFYNTIVWAGIPHPKPDHDLCLSGFEYPDRVCCNMPARFNVTLKNNGLNDEADVTVNLAVNGVVLNSTDISSIAQGANIPLHISWTPASPGVHRIDLSVTEVPGEAITFNNHLSAGIDVLVAGFSGEYSDYGSDTDGDGLYDYLTIEVGVNVAAAGDYRIYGELCDEYGSRIDNGGGDYVYLGVGSQSTPLEFSGIKIQQNGVNGTYNLTYLKLYDANRNRLDSIYDAYTTTHYDYTEFQRLPAEFSGEYSDYGTDTDGDGLYDYLTIEVGVDVITAGYYQVNGELYDSYGGCIEYRSNYTGLNAGNQTVQLNFDGIEIRRNSVNGTYNLKYLSLYDGDDQNRLDYTYDAYTTPSYNYTEFQRLPAEFSDEYSDYGTDTDGDGLYDYLVVDVGVNVIESGSYKTSGYFYDDRGHQIDYESNTTYLSAGDQIVQLKFEGINVRQNRVNGTFGLKSLHLCDSSTGDQLDYIYEAYTTTHYNYTDFKRLPAEFSDIYSDYGEDIDGDGLYDYLTIDVGVNVITAGYYQVNGELHENGTYNHVAYDSNMAHLNEGNQIVNLMFECVKIRNNKYNGAYDLKYVGLYNATYPIPTTTYGGQLDYRYYTYTTTHYKYTEFGYSIPDAHEPDDDYSLANYISVDGVRQTHNFHVPYDQDWLKFSATGRSSYTIETSDLRSDSNTCLYLYSTDGTTEICHDNDDGDDGSGLASKIVWNCNTSGTYYIMVKHSSPSTVGPETRYNISLTAEEIPLRGDANHDGVITPADATIALHLAASGGWDSAADVDGDNHITSLDALMIQQAAADAITF
jgi:serine protease AprX